MLPELVLEREHDADFQELLSGDARHRAAQDRASSKEARTRDGQTRVDRPSVFASCIIEAGLPPGFQQRCMLIGAGLPQQLPRSLQGATCGQASACSGCAAAAAASTNLHHMSGMDDATPSN